MNEDLYPHDIDLGAKPDQIQTRVLLSGQRLSPALLAVLHKLRDQAGLMDRTGRTPPSTCANGLEYRAYHAGAAEHAEEIFWWLWREMNAAVDDPDEQSGN